MMFNYVGLYYLVPTAADQPILIINMEKPQNNNNTIKMKMEMKDIMKVTKKKHNNHNYKRKYVKQIESEHSSDSINCHSSKHRSIKKKIIIKKSNKSFSKNIDDDEDDDEHETDDDDEYTSDETDDDTENTSNIEINVVDNDQLDDDDNYEEMPLLNTAPNRTTNIRSNAKNNKWYQLNQIFRK